MRTNMGIAGVVLAVCSVWACGGKKQIDYSAMPTKTTALTVDDVPVVADLPEGYKESALSMPTMKKWEAPAGPFDGPEITISTTYSMPSSVEEAIAAASVSDAPKRKERVGDAFVVSTETPGGGSFAVHTFVPATDDKALACSASYIRASGAIQNIAAQRAWAEKLCLSVKPKNPPEKIAVTAQMNEFLSAFGTGVSIGKALEKHGAKDLDSRDMELYDIKSPKITKAKKDGKLTCYVLRRVGRAGMTTRSDDTLAGRSCVLS